jgi:hypothetical protein
VFRAVGWSLLTIAIGLAAGPAGAHDSWLSPARTPALGGTALELSTGNRYPVQEFGSSASHVARAGCSDGAGPVLPLRPLREHPRWLDLRVDTNDAGESPLACWLELHAAQIELEPRLVQVYLAEIRAPAATRQAWAVLQARGLPWRESYRKFARIELADPAASPARIAAARQPVGLDLEIVVLGDQPIATGQPLAFQVLRDGRPLPGFAVELVSERSALGVWRETDGNGVLRHRLPFAGRWLLRGTDLRTSAQTPGTWESRFVTLAIEAR